MNEVDERGGSNLEHENSKMRNIEINLKSESEIPFPTTPTIFPWQALPIPLPKLTVTPPYTPRVTSFSFYSPPSSIPSTQNSSPDSPPPFISGRGIDTEGSEDDEEVMTGEIFDSRVLERGIGEEARSLQVGDSGVVEEMNLLAGIERLSLLSSPIKISQQFNRYTPTKLDNSESSSPWDEKSENEISNSIIERFPLPKLYPNSSLFTPPRYPPPLLFNNKQQGGESESPYSAPSPYSSSFYQRLFSDPTTILQPNSNDLLPSSIFDTPPPVNPPFNSPQSLNRNNNDSTISTNRMISSSSTTDSTSIFNISSPEISPDHSHHVQNQYVPFRSTINNKKGSLVIGTMNEIESIQAHDGEESLVQGEGEKDQGGNEEETEENSDNSEGNQELLEAMSPLSRCFRRPSLEPEDNSNDEDEDDKKDNRRNVSRRVRSDHSTSSFSHSESTPSDSGSVIELNTQDIKLRRLTRRTQELETKLNIAEREIEAMKVERATKIFRASLEMSIGASEGLGMEMGNEKDDEKSLEVVLAKMGVDIATQSPLILSTSILSLNVCPHCSLPIPNSGFLSDAQLQLDTWRLNHWNCLKELGGVIVLGKV